MSEGRNVFNRSIANASWLFSEQADRAISRSAEYIPWQEETRTRDIDRDSIRRNLEVEYSDNGSNDVELPNNVIIKRKILLDFID